MATCQPRGAYHRKMDRIQAFFKKKEPAAEIKAGSGPVDLKPVDLKPVDPKPVDLKMDDKIDAFFKKKEPATAKKADSGAVDLKMDDKIEAFFKKKEPSTEKKADSGPIDWQNNGLVFLVLGTAILGFFAPRGPQSVAKARDMISGIVKRESSAGAGMEPMSRAATAAPIPGEQIMQTPQMVARKVTQPAKPRDHIADALSNISTIGDQIVKPPPNPSMKQHLIVLGLPIREPTNAEIVEAYKTKAMECNPERFEGDEAKAASEVKLLDIKHSFRTLMQYKEFLHKQKLDKQSPPVVPSPNTTVPVRPQKTSLKEHLIVLGLPIREPTNTEILEAYRSKAAEYNTSELLPSDANIKALEIKLAQANDSFKALMRYKEIAHKQLLAKNLEKEAEFNASDDSGEKSLKATGLSMKSHLIILGLPLKEPSNSELIEAYRVKAAELNPQQYTEEDPRRKENEAKLADAKISFQTLTKYKENLLKQFMNR